MSKQKVIVIGGGGYVGSALCPSLVSLGYDVTAFDTFWYGEHVLPHSVTKVRGDMRNPDQLAHVLAGADSVIHLACISNDPSFDLNPELGRSINLDCFPAVCQAVRDAGVKRFIYASSSSVYGVHDKPVTEETACFPLTDYSKFKLLCEQYLDRADMGHTAWTIVRPATICGFAPRLRLDLIVNALTASALRARAMTVNGGRQLRPNLHIEDMCLAYGLILGAHRNEVHHEIFNVGARNYSVGALAEYVREVVADPELRITTQPSIDDRSYHVESHKIARTLGWTAEHSIEDAIRDLMRVFPYLGDTQAAQYHNIKRMKELNL